MSDTSESYWQRGVTRFLPSTSKSIWNEFSFTVDTFPFFPLIIKITNNNPKGSQAGAFIVNSGGLILPTP
jgi:hypothetical protein